MTTLVNELVNDEKTSLHIPVSRDERLVMAFPGTMKFPDDKSLSGQAFVEGIKIYHVYDGPEFISGKEFVTMAPKQPPRADPFLCIAFRDQPELIPEQVRLLVLSEPQTFFFFLGATFTTEVTENRFVIMPKDEAEDQGLGANAEPAPSKGGVKMVKAPKTEKTEVRQYIYLAKFQGPSGNWFIGMHPESKAFDKGCYSIHCTMEA